MYVIAPERYPMGDMLLNLLKAYIRPGEEIQRENCSLPTNQAQGYP
jgi:hypothetical protein